MFIVLVLLPMLSAYLCSTRIQDLRSCSRTGDVAQPQHSMYYLYSDLWYSLEATGHIFLVSGRNINLIENDICFGNLETTLK